MAEGEAGTMAEAEDVSGGTSELQQVEWDDADSFDGLLKLDCSFLPKASAQTTQINALPEQPLSEKQGSGERDLSDFDPKICARPLQQSWRKDPNDPELESCSRPEGQRDVHDPESGARPRAKYQDGPKVLRLDGCGQMGIHQHSRSGVPGEEQDDLARQLSALRGQVQGMQRHQADVLEKINRIASGLETRWGAMTATPSSGSQSNPVREEAASDSRPLTAEVARPLNALWQQQYLTESRLDQALEQMDLEMRSYRTDLRRLRSQISCQKEAATIQRATDMETLRYEMHRHLCECLDAMSARYRGPPGRAVTSARPASAANARIGDQQQVERPVCDGSVTNTRAARHSRPPPAWHGNQPSSRDSRYGDGTLDWTKADDDDGGAAAADYASALSSRILAPDYVGFSLDSAESDGRTWTGGAQHDDAQRHAPARSGEAFDRPSHCGNAAPAFRARHLVASPPLSTAALSRPITAPRAPRLSSRLQGADGGSRHARASDISVVHRPGAHFAEC